MKGRKKLKPLPAWMIWANPILKRYARSRLRPASLGVALLMTILVAGFFFFLARETTARAIQNPIDVGRIPLIPLLILQGLILFGLGTGQAAAGITTEADEGVIDYQRLAPMTPFAKVLGYLFGLPIREWILFLATIPFTGYSIWKGQVPLNGVLQLYAVFFMAAILYHLTGLVAGSVMKNRRWAFLTSTGLVMFLYLIIPQAAKFGLVYLKYVTIYPVFNEVYPSLIPRPLGDAAEVFNTIIPPAKFFGLNFPQYVFTLISQGVLSLAMVMMLWRRWRKADCHLLGKFTATGLFGWLQMMLLGNALPLMDSGDLFPSRELDRRFGRLINPDIQFWSPKTWEATVMIGIYGLVTLASLWWLTFIISPELHGQVRGWRRARKLGHSKLPVLSDAATSVPWVLTMSVMGAAGWFIFGRTLIESHWYPELSLLVVTPMAMFSILLCGGLGMAALLESVGRKVTGLVVILGGILPVMLGVILAVSSDDSIALAVWLAGICPVSWPVYGSGVFLSEEGMPRDVARAVPNAFWFWQGAGAILTVWLLSKLRSARKRVSNLSKEF
ncbi:MAG: hypothetical protein P8M04_03970 [Akkermansiaceae bacterium]|nr:hypothetical protein [Akkermansiaceae bacterium]